MACPCDPCALEQVSLAVADRMRESGNAREKNQPVVSTLAKD
jgi:hypothetical protein